MGSDRAGPFDPGPVLRAALSRGGDWAEVYHEHTRYAAVALEDRRVEEARESTRMGAGVRIVEGDRTWYGHVTAPDPGALEELAADLARARPLGAGTDPGPPGQACAGPAGGAFAGVDLAARADLCRRAEGAARGADRRVRQVRVVYRDHTQGVAVAASDGRWVLDLREGFYLGVLVVAADGDVVQTGYEAVGAGAGWDLFENDPPEEVALRAARRAVAMLEAPRAPGGPMPVVIAGAAGGTMIHEAVGHGLEADLVLAGHSVFADKVGEPIASPLVTVVDDPTLPGRRGSYAFDDEGTPARRTVLVDRGVLLGFLHSRITAARTGAEPTGHGRRESFEHVPLPRMANTFIAPGPHDPAEIVRSTPRGLYVTRMGGGQVNTVSGDFVFEVSEGYRIEGGEVGRPVRGATLVGNGPRVLREIDRVGGDLGFAVGTCGKDGQGVPVSDAQPTIRIPELVVGGAAGQDARAPRRRQTRGFPTGNPGPTSAVTGRRP